MSEHAGRTCPVWLYVLKDVPPQYHLLFRERGFRPAKKSANWYRDYDNRIAGTIDQRLATEERAGALGIQLDIRPLRRRKPASTKIPVPSAAAWLREHDKPSSRKRFVDKKRKERSKIVKRVHALR